MLTPSLALAAALLPLAQPAIADARPKVLGMETRRSAITSPLTSRRLRRRDKDINVNLSNFPGLGGYFINITVGTPPQPISVLLDTGSSDLWIPEAGTSICRGEEATCDLLGAFDSGSSSSFESIAKNQFEISYGDGTKITGDYVSDNAEIGGQKISNVTMGLADQGKSGTPITGILGIGYASHESAASQESDSVYPNVPSLLKSQGLINTNAYSLWLNDLDSSTGTILFGGVDSAKYVGPLMSMAVEKNKESDQVTEFIVPLTSVSFYGSTNATVTPSNYVLPVLLDSGTALSAIPDDLAQSIYNGLGVIQDDTFGAVLACKYAVNSDGFSFGFGGSGGVTVSVPMDELLTPLTDESNAPITLDNGDAACRFGLSGGGDGDAILGDAFMRSAYIVYDLDNNQIAMAQTKFNTTDTSIKEITGSDIPGATAVSGAPTATDSSSPTDNPRGSGLATQSAVATRVGGSNASPTFALSTAMASSSKAAAPSVVRAPTVSAAFVAVVVTLAASFFGGVGLMLA